MPTYGYRCSQCGHEFEVVQSMSDEPLRVCSECGGALRKMLYPVGVQFKGSGFYTTDYRNGGASKSDSGETGSSAGSEGSGSEGSGSSEKPAAPEKKAETKAEKKAEKKPDTSAAKE